MAGMGPWRDSPGLGSAAPVVDSGGVIVGWWEARTPFGPANSKTARENEGSGPFANTLKLGTDDWWWRDGGTLLLSVKVGWHS